MLRKIALQLGFMVAATILTYSQSGALVKSFGDSGIRYVQFDRTQHSDDLGGIIKRDTSDKILIAGTSANDTKREICVARLNTDGSLDTTFSQRGKLLIQADTSIIDETLTFDLDGHGNILLAGQIDSSGYCIIRLEGNGKPDQGFGTNGRVALTGFNGLIQQINMHFDSRRNIILGGYTLSGGIILRLRQGGTIDSSFGIDGKVLFPQGNPFVLQAFTIDLKDRILLSGINKYGPGNKAISVLRLTSVGIIDSTFGKLPEAPGKVPVYPINDNDDHKANTILVDSLDRILIGITNGHDLSTSILIRLYEIGMVDTSFGGGEVSLEKLRQFAAIAIDRNGKIFIAGPSEHWDNYPIWSVNTIYCLKNDGAPDSSFGVSGIYSDGTFYPYPKWHEESKIFYLKNLLLDKDEKILWAGTAFNETNLDFRITRLSVNGKEDSAFNATGTVWINGNDSLRRAVSEESAATSLILDHSGRTIMGGYSKSAESGVTPLRFDYCVVRLDTGGNPDLSFNNSGRILIPELYYSHGPQIACDENNKILISGSRPGGSGKEFFLQRFNEDGKPDTSFGSNGTALLSIMPYLEADVLIDIDTAGRIWLFREGIGDLYDCILRLTPEGQPDSLFNGTGKLEIPDLALYNLIYRSKNAELYVMGIFPYQEFPSNIPPKILKINDRGIVDTLMHIIFKSTELDEEGHIVSYGGVFMDGSEDNTLPDELIRFQSLGSDQFSMMNTCMNDSISVSLSSPNSVKHTIMVKTHDSSFARAFKTDVFHGMRMLTVAADCDYIWIAGQDSAEKCMLISKLYARDNQTIDFFLPDTVPYGASAIKLKGTASSGLPVSYASSNPAIALISKDSLHFTGSGLVTITVTQDGNGGFYAADPVSRNLVVISNVTFNPAHEIDKDIRAFPNPVSKILYIECKAKIKSVAITGVEGTILYERTDMNDHGFTFDISGYKPGFYILTIQLEDNHPKRTLKILKY